MGHFSLAAITGLAMRSALSLYLRNTLLAMLLLLITALAIDLAKHLPSVQEKAASSNSAMLLPYYILYRATDIITRMLPTACFLALFLSEILRRRRLESVILSASGFSPAQTTAAIFFFGLIVGSCQYLLEAHLRPAAVFAQVELGVGSYAKRFRSGLLNRPEWFITNGNALSGRVFRATNPELREVKIFQGINQDRLSGIILAERAVPTDKPNIWRLHSAVSWQGAENQGNYKPLENDLLDVKIDLVADQLTYMDVPGFYIPGAALKNIAAMHNAPTANDANVALWRRWTAILLPGAFALLGASLAQMGYSGRVQNIRVLAGLAFFGYISIVSVKVFWALGELGVFPPSAAVLSSLLLALSGSIFIQYRRS
jgi:lipopolysaccharide export LptBFGC system permease protein LptF